MAVRVLLIAAVLAGLVVAGPAASAARRSCADAAGGSFAFSVGASHFAGSSYRVSTTAVSCTFATGWVAS